MNSWKLSVGLLAAAVIIAILNGFGKGSLLAMALALAAAVPAGYGVWKGTQAESQWPMAKHMIALLFSLILAALFLLLRILHWIR